MTDATSSGSARRFMMQELIGDSSNSFFRTAGSGALPKCISVTIQPGATALTRMPYSTNSDAIVFVRETNPAFNRIVYPLSRPAEEAAFG